MAQSSTAKPAVTPQATGFSQVHARGGGEGGGQAMSVLLSWHEKVYHSPNLAVPIKSHVLFLLSIALLISICFTITWIAFPS